MTIGPDYAQAVTAFNRFGLGARPGDLNAAAGDPRGFLLEKLIDEERIIEEGPPRRVFHHSKEPRVRQFLRTYHDRNSF